MKYRREIDGLRAVAVLPVILFHAGFRAFGGGYVGVDVFFVISGYLITSIILHEKQSGKFTLKNFYERRARRILPALYTVLACCVPAAWYLLMPPDMKDFSQSLSAVSLFSSNFLFWQESGYFDTAAELKPLLHTWSLAVEEQYYLIYPVFLAAVWRFRKKWVVTSLIAIGLGSFALAQWGASHNSSSSFYLLPARGWELLIGAVAAFYMYFKTTPPSSTALSRLSNEIMGFAGLLMISYAVFTFNETTPFPGLFALLPTLGALLIILTTSPTTVAGKLLGATPLVSIGLISYSAYLWHYPMFAFARYKTAAKPEDIVFVTLTAASLIIAFIVWKYIEQPFRKKRYAPGNGIFKFAAAGIAIIFAFGAAGHVTRGFDGRFSADFAKIYEARSEINPKRKTCSSPDISNGLPIDKCMSGEQYEPDVFLWGDSHADAVAPALAERLNEKRMGMLELTCGGCPPVPGLIRIHEPQREICAKFNEAVMNYVANDSPEEYVVLIARWTLNYYGTRFNNEEGGSEYGINAAAEPVDQRPKNEEERKKLVAEYYVKLIKELLSLGKKVALVYPIPEVGWDVPQHLSMMWSYSGELKPQYSSTSYDVFKTRNGEIYEILDSIPDNPNLFRIKPEEIFCDTYLQNRCVTQLDGTPLYKDDNHLSMAGARMLADKIVKSMD